MATTANYIVDNPSGGDNSDVVTDVNDIRFDDVAGYILNSNVTFKKILMYVDMQY